MATNVAKKFRKIETRLDGRGNKISERVILPNGQIEAPKTQQDEKIAELKKNIEIAELEAKLKAIKGE